MIGWRWTARTTLAASRRLARLCLLIFTVSGVLGGPRGPLPEPVAASAPQHAALPRPAEDASGPCAPGCPPGGHGCRCPGWSHTALFAPGAAASTPGEWLLWATGGDGTSHRSAVVRARLASETRPTSRANAPPTPPPNA